MPFARAASSSLPTAYNDTPNRVRRSSAQSSRNPNSIASDAGSTPGITSPVKIVV